MATKRAKTLNPEQVGILLDHIDKTSTMPERDRLMVLLSFGAGLRACEIAKIDLSAMLDVQGRIDKAITVYSHVAKKRRERAIPMTPDIRAALALFRDTYPGAAYVAISSQPMRFAALTGREPTPTQYRRMASNTLRQYLGRLFKAVGFVGASSHSGRRTFATTMARRLADHDCSIKDLQLLLGHANLDTTEAYLEPSEGVNGLVSSMGYT